MKKILSLILCLAMLLSLGTLAISAEKIDGTTANVLYANYGTPNVEDGLKNDAMQMSAPQNYEDTPRYVYGACWDENNLYIGASGLIPVRIHFDSSTTPTAYPVPMSRVYASFENGVYAGVGKTGQPTNVATAASKEEARDLTVTHIYSGDKTYSGSFYGEFAVPLSKLSFYDFGDGTLATQVTLTYVLDNGNGVEGSHLSTTYTLVLTPLAIATGTDSLGKSSTHTTASNYVVGSHNTSGTRYVNLSAQGIVRLVSQKNANMGSVWRSNGVANTEFLAGKASVFEVDVQFNAIESTAGPNAAEKWNTTSVYGAGANIEGSNPQRVVMTVNWNQNGENAAMMAGYAIYNVGGEIRLYPATATNANDAYVVIPDVIIGATSGHVQFRRFFKLRLEFDAEYNVVVKVNDRKVGTFASTAAAASGHPLRQYGLTETAIYAISGGEANSLDVLFRNPYIASQSADAVAALEALGNSFTVYGHQDTVKAVDGKYSVRFLAELPATLADYTALGYDIVITNEKGTAKTTVDLTRVYESVSNDTTGHDGLKAVVALRDIKTADGDCTITVKPWVVAAKGGEKLYGEAYSVTYTAAADGTLSFE